MGIIYSFQFNDIQTLKKNLKRLKRISKQHSKKIAGSKNRKKSTLKLARQHRKIRNIRKDFLHKLSTSLAKTKSVIIVEDLDIKGMLRGPSKLNRPIHDAGWGDFRRKEYKTTWYDSKLIVAPRYYPSGKICFKCDYLVNKIPLSIRNWCCPSCHSLHDRDINSANNLLNFYTGSSPGIYACEDPSLGGTGNRSTKLWVVEARINELDICP